MGTKSGGCHRNFRQLPKVLRKPRAVHSAAPSHGIGVAPDHKTLWVNSSVAAGVFAYSMPDLKLLGGVALGGKGAGWLTITPDDKTAYVANEHTNDVSVVDIKSLKETARIPVGYAPARNATWMFP